VNGVFTRLLVPLVLGGCNPVSVGVASNGEMFSRPTIPSNLLVTRVTAEVTLQAVH